MLALVIAPHMPRLPWWSSVGAGLALLWRARAAWLQARLPGRAWLIFLLGVLLTLTWLTYGTLLGREAGITLVVMLATLKSLELKARRDALVCMYLGFFLIFTQFLFSQGIGTAALMLLTVWGLLMSLMLGQRPLGYPRLRELGRESLRAMLWGIPLMVGSLDVIANLSYAYASTHGALSVAAVLASMFPVVTVLMAHQLLGERLIRLQKVGVFTALTGVVLLTVA
jgi:hypothetical protein